MADKNYLAMLHDNFLAKVGELFDIPAQIGGKIINVKNANNVNLNTLPNGFMPKMPMDTEYYNLFVVGEYGTELKSPFFVPLELALKKGIDRDVKNEFFSMNKAVRERIKRFPSIFTYANSINGHTEIDHSAVYGMVIEIECLDGVGYMISWSSLSPGFVPQNDLIAHAEEFSLGMAPHGNELDDVHWTIKKRNVIEALRGIGIEPMVFM